MFKQQHTGSTDQSNNPLTSATTQQSAPAKSPLFGIFANLLGGRPESSTLTGTNTMQASQPKNYGTGGSR